MVSDNILVDQETRVRYMQHMGLFSTKPRTVQTAWSNHILLTDGVAQS